MRLFLTMSFLCLLTSLSYVFGMEWGVLFVVLAAVSGVLGWRLRDE